MAKITLEVPVSVGVERMISRAREGHSLIAYGSLCNSPLNGGRNNQLNNPRLDAMLLLASFSDVVNLNEKGIPFYLTLTNLVCAPEDLEDELTLAALEYLADNSPENGVIVANSEIELFVRTDYPQLRIASSCIRLYSQKEMLSESQRIDFYNESLRNGNYKLVILSPMDSRRPEIVGQIEPAHRARLSALVNTPCVAGCNSYWHYMAVSLFNKGDTAEIYKSLLEEALRRKEEQGMGCDSKKETIASDQIIADMVKLGVGYFKIGRNELSDHASLMDHILNLTHSLPQPQTSDSYSEQPVLKPLLLSCQ